MFTLPKANETPHTTTDIPEGAPLQQLEDALLDLVAREQTHHHRMGQIYNSIVEQKLAQRAGYKTAREFFSKRFADLSQATLSMYGAVADAFSEPVTQRYGVTRLYLLLRYKDAAGLEVNPEQPGETLIEVPDDKGPLRPLPFNVCSVEQMRQALRRKRKPASSKPLPPEAEALAEQYRAAVADRFPKGKGTRVKVLPRNEKGRAVLDFKGIPVEQVHQLLAALQSQQPSGLGVDAAAELQSPVVGEGSVLAARPWNDSVRGGIYSPSMIAPALVLTVQVLMSQAPAKPPAAPALAAQEQLLPGAGRPGAGPAATEPAPPAVPSLLPESSYPKRPSRAWVLVRAPVAMGAGAATGLAAWVVSYVLISIGTVPMGCFDYKTIHQPDWCYDVANVGSFVMAGVGSGAAVAGMNALLYGESDARVPLVAGLVGGIGFGSAYQLGDNPKKFNGFKGDEARVHRLAFVAVPALAIVSSELSALLSPGRPALVTSTVVPTAGGGLLVVGGRF